MKYRRGVSLVELLLVMSAATIILTMSAGLIHRIMHAHSKAQAFVDVERTSLRLANTFRRDIHQATVAAIDSPSSPNGVFLRLQAPQNQSIEYRREQGAVLRIVQEGNRIVSREAFAFPPGTELIVRKDEPRLVILSISSRPGELPIDNARFEPSAFAVPVNLHVEAVLNRDLP